MAQLEKWETFEEEEEEALSLSDLPVAADNDEKCKSKEAADDFEFRISAGGGLLSSATETDMCAADEVFFKGQILPLRPSISSDNGLFANSRCGSRSESMDLYMTTILSLGFNTSRSNSSSSRSSSCVSRSHSSNSHSSLTCDPPRLSLSNNFYTHPSPTPQVRFVRKASFGRKSTGSAPPGWGIFRLGVVKAPEIELHDLRSRRSNFSSISGRKSNADASHAIKKALTANINVNPGSAKCSTISKSSDAGNSVSKVEKKAEAPRFVGRGFSCRCSPDAVEPMTPSKAKVIITKKKKKDDLSLERGESMCRSRIFEWLEDLSIAKTT